MLLFSRLPIMVAIVGLYFTPLARAADPPAGSGAFHMNDGRGSLAASLRVFYHRPGTFEPGGPIVVVIHGTRRNADRYRDYWIDAATRFGALIVVPEFSREHYPGSRHFNLGNMFTRDGRPVPFAEWTFPVVDRVFKKSRQILGAHRQTYALFGHSAGAQFVHRMILFAPGDSLSRAVAANAGWYTLPSHSEDFPYGLAGTKAQSASLDTAFSRRLFILLGTADTDPQHRYLRRTDQAMRQGPHRFARGHHFFNTARLEAARLATPFSWRLVEIKGIGHSARRMVPPAAQILLGGR